MPTQAEALHQCIEALQGLMEIAEVAMPPSYFITDSRVNLARTALATAVEVLNHDNH